MQQLHLKFDLLIDSTMSNTKVDQLFKQYIVQCKQLKLPTQLFSLEIGNNYSPKRLQNADWNL